MEFKNETYRQVKIRINRLIDSLDPNDKDKIYSYRAMVEEDTIQEWSEEYDPGKNRSCVAWCEECNRFTVQYYSSRTCCACKSRKSGLGNPEIHRKTIKKQIETGTFNMLNEEVQRIKISNKNVRFKHAIKYCKTCKAETQHRIWPSGKVSCCKCDSKNNGLKVRYCEKCGEETLHNGSVCCECNPLSDVSKNIHYEWCTKCQRDTLHNGPHCSQCEPDCFNPFGGHFPVEIIHCRTCEQDTPHRFDKCQVCSGEKVWCTHCGQWESIRYNSIPFHWKFYKSATREWMDDNPELVTFMTTRIDGFSDINESAICGVYLISVDNIPWYVGQSTDVLSRIYDHMKSIHENPEYFNMEQSHDFVRFMNNHTVSVEVLEECEVDVLHEMELHWIDRLHPYSQKCNGTDHVIPLEERVEACILFNECP